MSPGFFPSDFEFIIISSWKICVTFPLSKDTLFHNVIKVVLLSLLSLLGKGFFFCIYFTLQRRIDRLMTNNRRSEKFIWTFSSGNFQLKYNTSTLSIKKVDHDASWFEVLVMLYFLVKALAQYMRKICMLDGYRNHASFSCTRTCLYRKKFKKYSQ